MPRTGPRWMRFIRCVVKPAILLRRRLDGMMATSSQIFLLTWLFRGAGRGRSVLGCPFAPCRHREQVRVRDSQVKGQTRVVLLDDDARSALDGLGTDAAPARRAQLGSVTGSPPLDACMMRGVALVAIGAILRASRILPPPGDVVWPPACVRGCPSPCSPLPRVSGFRRGESVHCRVTGALARFRVPGPVVTVSR